jgi:hypothetical protein
LGHLYGQQNTGHNREYSADIQNGGNDTTRALGNIGHSADRAPPYQDKGTSHLLFISRSLTRISKVPTSVKQVNAPQTETTKNLSVVLDEIAEIQAPARKAFIHLLVGNQSYGVKVRNW